MAASLINDFLKSMYMRKGSDLHVIAGDPPRMRVHGDLITLDNQRLDPEELKVALAKLPPEKGLDAEKVTRRVEALARDLAEDPPDKEMLSITGESLKRASENLTDVLPGAAALVARMIAAARRIHGL